MVAVTSGYELQNDEQGKDIQFDGSQYASSAGSISPRD
jgi:hypothetical protein